ncbi:MAG: glycosyl hydrolase family 95 catalytic domain-containing protein [Promethearchaeota archaeon]
MENHTMKCAMPASRWEDALPVGNGSVGALIYGNICHETIIFNHEALWIDKHAPAPPDISNHVKELREMLANGEWYFNDRFLDIMFLDEGFHAVQEDSYHPAFELKIDRTPLSPFKNYSRVLDLATGEVEVGWEEKGMKFTRRCFVSRDDGTFFIEIASSGNRIDCSLQLKAREPIEENRAMKNKTITWKDIPIKYFSFSDPPFLYVTGTYDDGHEFGGIAMVIAPGGTITGNATILKIEGAEHVLIKIRVFPRDQIEGDDITSCGSQLAGLSDKYDELLAKHAALHGALYNRVELDLDIPVAERRKSNEMLLLESYNSDVAQALVERMFNFGRYLLISSSAPGGWPANLQGIWNGNYFPAWSSDYHNDENIQMNYWLTLPCNLAEMALPYFDFYEACLPDYRRNAKMVYGCRGILAPIAQTVKGKAPLYGGAWLNWTAGAGWLSQLFNEYWLFTRDDEFLEKRTIPFLKDVALFYEDFLFEGNDGKLVFSPSLSPENTPDIEGTSLVTINATMDVSVCKEVITNLVKGCERVGVETENLQKWKSILEKLPDYQVNQDGAMKEWIHPDLKDNYHHRHLSHVYGLFPGFEITKETNKEIYEACRVAVEKRLVVGQESQSGWSLAHMSNVWSRLSEGDRALEVLETLLRSSVGTNLFTYHNDWRHMGLTLYWDFIDKIFQIDANFGFTAAIVEMLLFSNENMIKILPARPAKWKHGRVRGLRTRCGCEISIEWDEPSNYIHLSILPSVPIEITVKFPGRVNAINSNLESTFIQPSQFGSHYRQIAVKAGVQTNLDVKLDSF